MLSENYFFAFLATVFLTTAFLASCGCSFSVSAVFFTATFLPTTFLAGDFLAGASASELSTLFLVVCSSLLPSFWPLTFSSSPSLLPASSQHPEPHRPLFSLPFFLRPFVAGVFLA